MKKKLGPLPVWQWAAIGVAAGLALYLYSRRQGAGAAAAVGATPAAAQYDPTLGPIDPTTGLPYASSGSGASSGVGAGALLGSSEVGATQNAAPMSLADELHDFGLIVGLLSSINGVKPATDATAGSAADQPASAIGVAPAKDATTKPGYHAGHSKGHDYFLPGTGWVSQARYLAATVPSVKSITQKVTSKVTTPAHNPGHTVTTKDGKHSPSSSAPHSKQQHANVAPPAHQRHAPVKHPSKPKAHIEHAPPPLVRLGPHPATPPPPPHLKPGPALKFKKPPPLKKAKPKARR